MDNLGKKVVSGIIFTTLLVGTLTMVFNVQPAKASGTGTIYIRADGSVDPPTALIERVGDVYTFTDNIYVSIVVERNNIVIDGAGYTLQGSGDYDSKGIDLTGRSNVTIKNMEITTFENGIWLNASSQNSIYSNNITNNDYAVELSYSSNNNISRNNITNNRLHTDANNITIIGHSILLRWSSNNSISGNNITNNNHGILLWHSSNNSIYENLITANGGNGIVLDDSSNNFVHGNDITTNGDDGIKLWYSSNYNSISENNIKNNRWGIELDSSSNNSISGNTITYNDVGIRTDESSNNSIYVNNITNHVDSGITLFFSSNNTIYGNNITNSFEGIGLYSSPNNSVSGNRIANNYNGVYVSSSDNSLTGNIIRNNDYGIWLSDSSNNRIFHNNLVENQQHTRTWRSSDFWDDDYPSGGNYWTSYEERYPDAEELNGSGIWNTPYVIDEYNQDNYPLISPTVPIMRVFTINSLQVKIYSNSSISAFQFNGFMKQVSFNVSGSTSTTGFCNVTIPNTIIQDLWQGNYSLLVNGQRVDFANWTDNINTYIYFTYLHSTQEVKIIPEFPTWTLMLLVLIVATVVIAIYKRRRSKHQSAREHIVRPLSSPIHRKVNRLAFQL